MGAATPRGISFSPMWQMEQLQWALAGNEGLQFLVSAQGWCWRTEAGLEQRWNCKKDLRGFLKMLLFASLANKSRCRLYVSRGLFFPHLGLLPLQQCVIMENISKTDGNPGGWEVHKSPPVAGSGRVFRCLCPAPHYKKNI